MDLSRPPNKTIPQFPSGRRGHSSRIPGAGAVGGWGPGLHSKVAYLDTENPAYRSVLKQYPIYDRALSTGLPFPKTRRIIFEGGAPSSLPGWVVLEVA